MIFNQAGVSTELNAEKPDIDTQGAYYAPLWLPYSLLVRDTHPAPILEHIN